MRTLFLKTLLWFLGTVIITMVLIAIVSALTYNSGNNRPPPFGMFLSLQLSGARHACEPGGPPALVATLKRLEKISQAEGILTDEKGKDLVTGEDRSDLVGGTEPRRSPPLLRRNRAQIARRSPDG